jgi:hypothetical protein
MALTSITARQKAIAAQPAADPDVRARGDLHRALVALEGAVAGEEAPLCAFSAEDHQGCMQVGVRMTPTSAATSKEPKMQRGT